MENAGGDDLLLDESSVGEALRRLLPLVGEMDAVVAELDSVDGDLGRVCRGHHTGTEFAGTHAALTRMTALELGEIRRAVVAFADDLTRTVAELTAADEALALDMKNPRC